MKAFSADSMHSTDATDATGAADATGATLRVLIARSFLQRARGLLGRPSPAPGCGLLLKGVTVVHGFGMRHPLDLLFLDRAGAIVQCERLAPGRVRACPGAGDVLELRAGEIERLGLREGQRPLLVPVEDIFNEALAFSGERPMPSSGGAAPGFRTDLFALLPAGLSAALLIVLLALLPRQAVAQAPRAVGSVINDGILLPPVGLIRPLSAQAIQALEQEAELLYRDGKYHLERTQVDQEAIRLYESLAEVASDRSSHAWLRIGNLHQRSGAVGKAIDAYRQVFAPGAVLAPDLASTAVPARAPDPARRAAVDSAGRKALLNLASLAIEQATESLNWLDALPAAFETREQDGRAPMPQEPASASVAIEPYRRRLQSLAQQLTGRQDQQQNAATPTASEFRQRPFLVERYTASARRNRVKAARGSLHVDPADELPARPLARPQARPLVDQLPRVEYLLGDPERFRPGATAKGEDESGKAKSARAASSKGGFPGSAGRARTAAASDRADKR